MTEIPVQDVQAQAQEPKAGKPVDFQPLVNAGPELLKRYLKLSTVSDMVTTLAAYALGAVIVGCATYLAVKGVIEGQAIAAFLGAAIGYIFAKTGGSS